jgi:enolase
VATVWWKLGKNATTGYVSMATAVMAIAALKTPATAFVAGILYATGLNYFPKPRAVKVF